MQDMQAKGRYLAFLAFTFTLCFILILSTILLMLSKMPIADYKEIIIVLGIPTIVGMAFNSFFHTNPKTDDVKEVVAAPAAAPTLEAPKP